MKEQGEETIIPFFFSQLEAMSGRLSRVCSGIVGSAGVLFRVLVVVPGFI
jgi:hypothetical protein